MPNVNWIFMQKERVFTFHSFVFSSWIFTHILFVVVVDNTAEAIAKTNELCGNLRNHLNHISQMREFSRTLKVPFKWIYRSWMLWLLLLEATFSPFHISHFTFILYDFFFLFLSITHLTLIHCYTFIHTSSTMYRDKHICIYFWVWLHV